MVKRGTPWFALVCGAACVGTLTASAASVSDYSVRVSATVQTNPAFIRLSWPADPGATDYLLYRKARDDKYWITYWDLGAGASNYVDSTVAVGQAYEYRVSKSASTYFGEGYLYAGIEVPLVESRGKVILLADTTYASSLTMELQRLQQDLAGDGWTVLRHDVARADSVSSIKAIIRADYNADPANVKALFLLGHVPVPYSGDIAPDGHTPAHTGAWPADVYYGDIDGTWTDSTINDAGASSARNQNVPGDSKFDQSTLPSSVDLQVGRVDLKDLPAFSLNEGELLRQYLNKDHSFRHRLITAERRGWIDDHSAGSEAFAVNGWRNFSAFFGASNVFAGQDWCSTLATNSCLWGYGCGGGTYTSADGVATTSQLATNDPRVVFTMFFGSWFGDWDSQNNLLRAALATPTYTLANAWAGRPHWAFHHMALGETIGFSARVTQNNSSTYSANTAMRYVHIALMGDPTLRMHVVAPPTNLLAAANGSGGVGLTWNPSPDTVAGYHVYRAPTPDGPFTRLNGALLSTTSYTDPVLSSSTYMVRAVKLEVSGSGSYWNASQGIFASVQPVLTITAPSTVAENAGSVRIYVSRTVSSAGAVSVSYATANGTATAGSDYTVTSGTLNWANGDTTDKYFDVPILNDNLYEDDETFTVTLSATAGAILGTPSTATVTIVDAANHVPSFVKGPDLTSLQSSGSQVYLSWATSISPGRTSESGQALNFIVTNDKNFLFSVLPAINAGGGLTYMPALNLRGTATVTVQLHDNGGTANGGQDTSAPQTFLLTIGSAADVNHNGLPDDWEAAYGLSGQGPSQDSDGDGGTNGEEFLAGTDPTNAEDCLSITAIEAVSGGEQVSVRTVLGKLYRVERSDSLPAGLWSQVGADLSGTGGIRQILDPDAPSLRRAFYRVRLVQGP
jgi:hypothetical protein